MNPPANVVGIRKTIGCARRISGLTFIWHAYSK